MGSFFCYYYGMNSTRNVIPEFSSTDTKAPNKSSPIKKTASNEAVPFNLYKRVFTQ